MAANFKCYAVRLKWICFNNVVLVTIFLSPACMGEALLKLVMLLTPLEFRICCSLSLDYGLTSEWVNEFSVRISTEGFMQQSSLPGLQVRSHPYQLEYTFVISVELSKCRLVSFNRNITQEQAEVMHSLLQNN